MQEAALEHQQELMDDLAGFTPINFLGLIAEAAGDALSEWLAEMQRAWFIGLLRLPVHVFTIVTRFLEIVWNTQTTLASIVASISFVLAAMIGMGLASEKWEGLGLLAAIPGVAIALVIGSVLCPILWALVWLGLTFFGWVTILAGYCAVVGGLGSGVIAMYTTFRVSRLIDQRMESGDKV